MFVDESVIPTNRKPITLEKYHDSPNAQIYVSVAQLKHDQTWRWEHVPTQDDEWLAGGSSMQDYAWFEPFDGEQIVSSDQFPFPSVHVDGKVFDWEDEMWKNADQRKRKYEALEDDQSIAAAGIVQSKLRDLMQQADPSNSAPQLSNANWRSALKAELKSLVRQEMGEDIQQMQEEIKEKIMGEIMEEMESEMRLEIEKELRETMGKR